MIIMSKYISVTEQSWESRLQQNHVRIEEKTFLVSETSCGDFLTGPSGTVTSSNYPGNYNNDDYCTWQIQVPVNKKVRLDFTEFKTETGKDYMLIYDTSHYESPTIVFDGTTYLPPSFTSSGNVLRVRFISDGETTRKGFSFNYKQVGR